jgi:hypothetical protein
VILIRNTFNSLYDLDRDVGPSGFRAELRACTIHRPLMKLRALPAASPSDTLCSVLNATRDGPRRPVCAVSQLRVSSWMKTIFE